MLADILTANAIATFFRYSSRVKYLSHSSIEALYHSTPVNRVE